MTLPLQLGSHTIEPILFSPNTGQGPVYLSQSFRLLLGNLISATHTGKTYRMQLRDIRILILPQIISPANFSPSVTASSSAEWDSSPEGELFPAPGDIREDTVALEGEGTP